MTKPIWDSGSEISRDAVSDLEKDLGVKFPQSYVALVTCCDGGSPDPSTVRVFNTYKNRLENSSFELIRIVPIYEDNLCVKMMQNADDHVEGTVEFASDAGGDFIAFDYRNNPESDNPPVVLINRVNPPEFTVLSIASSFDEFISMIGNPSPEG